MLTVRLHRTSLRSSMLHHSSLSSTVDHLLPHRNIQAIRHNNFRSSIYHIKLRPVKHNHRKLARALHTDAVPLFRGRLKPHNRIDSVRVLGLRHPLQVW